MRQVAVLCLFAALAARAGGQESGSVPLFNGRDLKGWKVLDGKEEAWEVEDGRLVTRRPTGWLMTEKEYGDFELELEYRLGPRANTGIALRSPFQGNPSFTGMEIQILDDAGYKEGLKPEQKTGSIWDVRGPSKDAARPAGQWNKVRVTAKGTRLTVEINGVVVQDVDLEDHKDRLRADPAKQQRAHPGLLRRSGHVGVQSMGGTAAFRNIRIKALGE
jgi:hypothetical protein